MWQTPDRCVEHLTDIIGDGRRHKVRRPEFAFSVNKSHVTHGHRMGLGVHQHLVPAVKDNRLVIEVAHLGDPAIPMGGSRETIGHVNLPIGACVDSVIQRKGSTLYSTGLGSH